MSGPTDVSPEKGALRSVVDDLNDHLLKTKGVQLRVVDWTDNVRPGINVDPQTEINRQIGTQFDIYLGILGTRFGTPTINAGSGTEDEFEQSIERFRNNTCSLRVLVYFKSDQVDPYQLDLEQFQKVKEFKATLHSRGVLYRDFRDTEDFVRMVRKHLDSLISDDWNDGNWSPIKELVEGQQCQVTNTAVTSSKSLDSENETGVSDTLINLTDIGDEEDEDLGLLDHMDSFNEEATALNQSLKRISKNITRIGDNFRARASNISALQKHHKEERHIKGSRAYQEFVRNVRTEVDLAADNLFEFVQDMIPGIGEYRTHSRAMFTDFRKGVQASSELGNPQGNDSQQALENLISILESSRVSTVDFQGTLDSIPALTGKFRRAKRKAGAVIGQLIAELSLTADMTRTALKTVSDSNN